jgi:hypothetical protein
LLLSLRLCIEIDTTMARTTFFVLALWLQSCSFALGLILGDHVQPVIGILTQPPSPDVDNQNFSLIDASYVKYLEGGGAVVVPILFNQSIEDTTAQFFELSGVFFTGGPAKPTDFARFILAYLLRFS